MKNRALQTLMMKAYHELRNMINLIFVYLKSKKKKKEGKNNI